MTLPVMALKEIHIMGENKKTHPVSFPKCREHCMHNLTADHWSKTQFFFFVFFFSSTKWITYLQTTFHLSNLQQKLVPLEQFPFFFFLGVWGCKSTLFKFHFY